MSYVDGQRAGSASAFFRYLVEPVGRSVGDQKLVVERREHQMATLDKGPEMARMRKCRMCDG